MKAEYKLENGVLEIQAAKAVDMDKDGKASAEVGVMVKLHAYELVTELAKKDLPMLESVIAQVKASGQI